MAKKDIYKIDNYFISWGYVLFFIGGLGTLFDPSMWYDFTLKTVNGAETHYTYEDSNGRTLESIRNEKGPQYEITEKSFPLVRTIMAVNGFLLLVIGYTYRSREKKIITVWNALDHAGEARVADLSINLGLPREFILKHLKDINAQTHGAFTYDSRSDKIINSRLLTEFLVMVDCVSCGTKINQKVSLDLSNPPRCNYCGTGVPADHLNKLKQEVILSLKSTPVPSGSDFNVGIFIALLIFFWPAAVIYVIKKKVMVSGGVASKENISSLLQQMQERQLNQRK